MSWNPWKFASLLALAGFSFTALVGCTPTKPIYLNDNGDLSYYLEQATDIEYPDVDVPSLEEVVQARTPITVLDPDFDTYYDLTLEQCVGIALKNSQVFRGYGTPSLQQTRVLPGQDNLANGVGPAGTIFNVAIRESEAGFIGSGIPNPSAFSTNTALDSNQGVEAALADFDAQFSSSVNWGRSDEARNAPVGSPFDPQVFQQDSVQWNWEIAKKSATGTQFFFRNTNNYTSNNIPLANAGGFQVLDSWYRSALEAEIRQPLLRGRGAFIQRMPIVISRINTDQELANLEAQLHNVVTNVEIRYWELYNAYRALETAKHARNAALDTYKIVNAQYEGKADVNIQQVAQSREQYFTFEGQVNTAFTNLMDAEGKLRFLMGLSATDGQVIRPIDEAIVAPVEFDWCESLCEALSYRPELRQERWEIKKRELALAHAKNGLLPEFNVTALYRWLGNGNFYGTSEDDLPFPDQTSGALNELYSGAYQEFQFGGEFRMPIGFRRELANVKNAQLKVAREIARLEDMELDVSRELTESYRALHDNLKAMQINYNRWIQTKIEEDHYYRLETAGVETLNTALTSQRRRAEAELAYYNSLCEYNKNLALFHRRKGTILAYNGISFAEGPWAGKAYIDAEEHARRRGASQQVNYGWTRPNVISRGPEVPGGYQNVTTDVMMDPNGAPMVEELPMDQPYYPTEATPQVMPEALPTITEPTSVNLPNNSSARRQYQTIQQVSYQEPAAGQSELRQASVVSAQQGVTLQATANQVQPAPARDQFTQPQSNQALQTAQQQPQPNVSRPPVRSGGMNWEKFGMTNPNRNSGGVRAKIKNIK